VRTCGGCKRKGENEEFIRFILFEGKLLPDVARKLPGRGFNVCPNYGCIKQFVKKKFRGKVDPEEVYKTALKALKDYFLHLLSLCHKTGITVIGQDNVKKLPPNREGILILSSDLSPGTKKRLKRGKWLILEDAFSSEEIGGALKRGARIGALFVEKVGLGRKLYSIARKLVNLEGKDG
jgi:predicted RNA-binding protein YlxR (DUF448 family)